MVIVFFYKQKAPSIPRRALSTRLLKVEQTYPATADAVRRFIVLKTVLPELLLIKTLL